MERLRQRADFLLAAAAHKIHATAFVLQARRRDDDGPARFGFTVSRKVGTAVERNRARRRLKEVVRLTTMERVKPGHDYVLVARRASLTRSFAQMVEDLDAALRRVSSGQGRGKPPVTTGRGAEGVRR
jgi:ribonuclease P protein component